MAKTRRANYSKEVLTSNEHNQENLITGNIADAVCSSRKLQERVSSKKVTWSDEHIQSLSVGDIDPAILCVQERVMIRYSREELLEIGKSAISKAKPDFLDPNEVCVSILDPEKWNLERKKSDTPDTGSKGTDNGENRRRSGDPRERIRKENDGIVLSPQRRSFNSGCFVPANKESLGGKSDPPPHLMGVRDIASSTRRIGSGRILRDWPESEKDLSEPDFSFSRGAAHARNNEWEDKFSDRGMREENKFGERRSFGRDIDNGKDKEGRRNTRYSESRRKYAEKEDEPEWFSSGPISQNDTIELRGFDESEKLGKKKQSNRIKRAKEWPKKKEATIVEDKEKNNQSKERVTPNHVEATTSKEAKESGAEQKKQSSSQSSQKQTDQKQQSSLPDPCFDFDEFLKGENIPGLLTNGVGNEADKTTSRFSRWFKKESPNNEMGEEAGRRSSIQEDNHIIKDLLKDINESSSIPMSIRPPMDSNTYFAPISPAGNSLGGLEGLIGDKSQSTANVGQPLNIMDILARSRQQPQQTEGWGHKSQASSMSGGKILSLDELESKIRPNSEHSANVQQKQSSQKPDEEMTAAFKRLLQQAGAHPGSQNGPMNKPPPMSLLEMLNHSQQQDEARLAAAQAAATQQQHIMSAFHAHQAQPQVHNDLALKLQQAQLQQKQLDMLVSGKLMTAGTTPAAAHMRSSPLLEMGAQQSRELLSRPEAQAILQAIHQRIPSPRELQVHTQNILQRALIKKKLEEQTENFRKKQELQRGASPNLPVGLNSRNMQSGKGISSPTPLAFTPTSVLRKMTADKDEAGRPIVKANNYQSQTPDQFFAQLAAQQQPLPQQRTYQAVSTAAHRKPIIGQQYPAQGSQYGQSQPQYSHPNNPQTFPQPTAQQLRAQHQHRSSNPVTQQPANVQGQQNQVTQSQANPQPATFQKQQGNPQPIGYPQAQQGTAAWQQFLNSTAQQQNNRPVGTSAGLSPSTADQLTRWFSPDLLERARGGELPSTANLARLEEIERQAAPTVHN